MVARASVADVLAFELGDDVVLTADDELEAYGRDASTLEPSPPEAVVLPTSAEEVAAALAVSEAHGIPVTPRGAGTGLTGGAIPVRGGAVLSLERMTRIVEVDEDSLVAVVEPGVVTGDLQAEVEACRLFYPPDPASLATCSIGGNVAHNAGGPRAFKYGVTRDYVLGLEAVLPGGRRLRTGRRSAKGVTGYDLTALLVGSEGTLAVVTQVVLRLLPAPGGLALVQSLFPDLGSCARAATAVLHAGFRPRALELVDGRCLRELRRAGYALPDEAEALLLVELDDDEAALPALLRATRAACERHGAVAVREAVDPLERDLLWSARRAVYPTLVAHYPGTRTEDVCVPRGRIAQLVERLAEAGRRSGVEIATLGHAGDGNLHVALLLPERPAPGSEEERRLREAIEGVLRAALDLGGTITAEHGVGLAKVDYLGWELEQPAISLQRALKREFDPHNLLNPGKIFAEGGAGGG